MWRSVESPLRQTVPAVWMIAVLGCALALFPVTARAGPGSLMDLWPELFRQSGSLESRAAAASVPLPRDADADLLAPLQQGAAAVGGRRVQAQPVAFWPGSERPRRVILRWIDEAPGEALAGDLQLSPAPRDNAGWAFDYRLLESTQGERIWRMATKNVPLDETEYEMYQLDLSRGGDRIGLRLGVRHNDRIYWWQFVRADFLQRGPVCDILRAGGPIYNEQGTLQSDLYLVLYANGVIEATAHFVNHQREGEAIDLNGVPVVALQIAGKPEVAHTLDGKRAEFALGTVALNLGQTVHMADAARSGSLRTEGDVVVLQPWLDQQVYGGRLVYDEGVPEHRIIRRGGLASDIASHPSDGREADEYWVTTVGDRLIPKGLARSFGFALSLDGARAEVVRYQAPAWWHAVCRDLPTRGLLPASWWAVPRALEVSAEYFVQQRSAGPFEYGRRSAGGDGSLGAAMLTLGHAAGVPRLCSEALPALYWRADIPIDHVDFSICELPYFGWQWIIQPYWRFMGVVRGYLETGDPYLLETAECAADSYYRAFVTNRPHRSVGRDTLPVFGLLEMYRATGEGFYLRRARRLLAEARRSYDQPQHYHPGHSSGAGPNGVARHSDYQYIPALLARLHADLLALGGEDIPPEEREQALAFMRSAVEVMEAHWPPSQEGWYAPTGAHLSVTFAALADAFPGEADHYGRLLNKYNAFLKMPQRGGAKPYSWVAAAVGLDAWVWGATWEDGTLHLRPQSAVLDDPRAPKRARIFTPKGAVEVQYSDGKVGAVGSPSCPVRVHGGSAG